MADETLTQLRERARELNVEGRSSMDAEELRDAIRRAEAEAAIQAAAAAEQGATPAPATSAPADDGTGGEPVAVTQEEADAKAAETPDDDTRAELRAAIEARAAERTANMVVIGASPDAPDTDSEETT